MAINLDDRYPGRANPRSLEYPQGSFKDRSSPDSQDGTYLQQDWANDIVGFLQYLLSKANIQANGVPDTAIDSQYAQALQALVKQWVPIAQGVGNSTTSVMSQKAVTDELNKKGTLGAGSGEVRTNSQNDSRFIQGGSIVQSLGSSTTDVPSQKLLNDRLAIKADLNQPGTMGLGVGQVWQTVNRDMNVAYTNTTGRAIAISVVGYPNQQSKSTTVGIRTGGNIVFAGGGYGQDPGSEQGVMAIIPNGTQYQIEGVGFQIKRVSELR